mmetsp:Transcript_23137/g.41322  ORF Transcript_23137/g.41322 Transcript_23137/m.41322 type:complete len:95 (-) Transcript_23137:132-416(-)
MIPTQAFVPSSLLSVPEFDPQCPPGDVPQNNQTPRKVTTAYEGGCRLSCQVQTNIIIIYLLQSRRTAVIVQTCQLIPQFQQLPLSSIFQKSRHP